MAGPGLSDAAVARMTTGAVLVVAAVAAVISYVHITAVAGQHGGTWWPAHLLPVAVDGQVAAASLALVRDGRRRQRADWLAYVMLAAGVAATAAANFLYGWPHGVLSAVIWTWPSLAFIGSADLAIRSLRKAARAAAARPPVPAAGRVPAGHRAGRGGRPAAAITTRDLAEQMGVSDRTARRRLAALRAPAAAEAGQ